MHEPFCVQAAAVGIDLIAVEELDDIGWGMSSRARQRDKRYLLLIPIVLDGHMAKTVQDSCCARILLATTRFSISFPRRSGTDQCALNYHGDSSGEYADKVSCVHMVVMLRYDRTR